MDKFTIEKTKFDDVLIITPKIFQDPRGYFCESYNEINLKKLGFNWPMPQDNESLSNKNTLRGLHYQWQPPMGKLVRVVKGAVKDVVVDIRANSPTYGEHTSVILSDKNHKQLWVPPGFAHGILILEDQTITLYKCSGVYNKDCEGSISPFDKQLDIDWGIPKEEIILSERDQQAQSFGDYNKATKFEFGENK